MKIIAVTGGIGSGKTTVSKMFEDLGAEVCDADLIAKETEKCGGAAYDEIKNFFGEQIILPNGEIDRKVLADIVFSDKKKLEKLNKIVHKYVFFEMEKTIKNSSAEVVCLDVPLLFSSDFPIKYDFSVGVTADMEERIKRVLQRDKTSEEDIKKRIKNQISDKELFEKADFVVKNNDKKSTFKAVENIFNIVRNG